MWAGGRAVAARNDQGKVHARPESWRAPYRTRADRARSEQRWRQEYGLTHSSPQNVRRGAGKAQTRPAEALAGRDLRINCTSFVGVTWLFF